MIDNERVNSLQEEYNTKFSETKARLPLVSYVYNGHLVYNEHLVYTIMSYAPTTLSSFQIKLKDSLKELI